jgi:hypothetical protein
MLSVLFAHRNNSSKPWPTQLLACTVSKQTNPHLHCFTCKLDFFPWLTQQKSFRILSLLTRYSPDRIKITQVHSFEMPPALSSIFYGLHNYAYEFITPPEDDECMICREPYANTETGKPGCQAIRLTHCNHLIGLESFPDWLRHQPDACPYWSHPLPSSFENSRVGLLQRMCTSNWYYCMEHFAVDAMVVYDGYYADGGYNSALIAHCGYHPTMATAITILSLYSLYAVCASVVGGLVIYVPALLVFTMLHLGYIGMSSYLGPLPLMLLPRSRVWTAFNMGIVALGAVNAGLFILTTLGVLSLGLWRSFKLRNWKIKG